MGMKADLWRRGLGSFFLLAALGMLVAGKTLLRERLSAPAFLVFWLICLLCTCLALLVAFLDVAAIRRRTREEQRALLENTLQEIARQTKSKSKKQAEQDESSN